MNLSFKFSLVLFFRRFMVVKREEFNETIERFFNSAPLCLCLQYVEWFLSLLICIMFNANINLNGSSISESEG